MDARVEDYLNDKIQTEADLDSLDVLIQAAQEQQALLRRQVMRSQLRKRKLRLTL